MQPGDTQGPGLLRAWLTEEERSGAWLGRQLGITETSPPAWLSGRRTPTLAVAAAIEHLTGGAVPAISWVPGPKKAEAGAD